MEAEVTPLSRACLAPGGLLAFALQLAARRPDHKTGQAAGVFLRAASDPLVWCIAAAMTDAGSVALEFLRSVDTEGKSIMEVFNLSREFIDELVWLIDQEGILTMPGHLTFIIDWLKTPKHYAVKSTAYVLGGSDGTADVRAHV